MTAARTFVPIRTRGRFWATCACCAGTIRHDPPHSTAYYDPADPEFKSLYHQHCAEQLSTVPEPRRTALILQWKQRANLDA